jgi:DeoR family deoxyribose operon repressor
MNKRQEQELILLADNHFLSVKQLSSKLNVSEMTIRRDILFLDQNNLAKQIFGGIKAIPVISDYDRSLEITLNTKKKIKIAKIAASMINEHDIIFFDTGTTVELIADYIDEDIECTFITYSLPVINKLIKFRKSTLIVCGGKYSHKSNSFLSNDQTPEIEKYRANKAFIGITGFDKELGVTCSYIEERSLKHAIIRNSKEAIIVSDSSKFGFVSTCIFGKGKDFTKIITDSSISKEYEDFLQNSGIETIKTP